MTIAVAHRGEPVDHKENTFPSFLTAVSEGADMVELDCRVTRDKRVVVLHDPTLERLWHLNTAVSELTFDTVRGLDVDGYHVPGLGEALKDVNVPVMVDMDDPTSVLERSKRLSALVPLNAMCSPGTGAARGAEEKEHGRAHHVNLNGQKVARQDVVNRTGPEFFNPRWDLLMPDAMAKMHTAGIGVSTWTVDDPATMASLVRMGADAIITNRIGCWLRCYTDRGTSRRDNPQAVDP